MELACYNPPAISSPFIAKHSHSDLQRLVATRMVEIWNLAQSKPADMQILLFALDAHYPALLFGETTNATMASLYAANKQPNSSTCNVYSQLNVSEIARQLAKNTVKSMPILSDFVNVPPAKPPMTAEQKLFAQASVHCRSVRYIADRFTACSRSPVAQSVAGTFLLGAYNHATPAALEYRKRVYESSSTVSLLIESGLTSRELHEALMEFCIVHRTDSPVVAELPEWHRARLRAWGNPLGPCRSRAERNCAIPSSPLSRLAQAAAPTGKWCLGKAQQTQITAAMQNLGPPTLWSAIHDAEQKFGCQNELLKFATSPVPLRSRLSTNAVLAASVVLRRHALTVCALNAMIVRTQREALETTKGITVMNVTICTGCCTLCTAPQGQCPTPTGLRVSLVTGETTCVRCGSGNGLFSIDLVGKMLTFATPSMALLSVVVCSMCGTITRFTSDYTWGIVPLCGTCYNRCCRTTFEPHVCWCGKSVGANATTFCAIDDDGRDVVSASCGKHAHITSVVRRPHLSDLRLLYSK